MRLHLWHSDTKTHLSAKTKGNNLKMKDKKQEMKGNERVHSFFFYTKLHCGEAIFWKVTKGLSFYLYCFFTYENLCFCLHFSKKANEIEIHQKTCLDVQSSFSFLNCFSIQISKTNNHVWFHFMNFKNWFCFINHFDIQNTYL